jgi:hypothetical protein
LLSVDKPTSRTPTRHGGCCWVRTASGQPAAGFDEDTPSH